MANSFELSVYKKTDELLIDICHTTAALPRELKYGDVKDIKRFLFNIQAIIFKANSYRGGGKVELLENAKNDMLQILVRLRLLHNDNQIPTRAFARLASKYEAVMDELDSWQSYFKDPEAYLKARALRKAQAEAQARGEDPTKIKPEDININVKTPKISSKTPLKPWQNPQVPPPPEPPLNALEFLCE